MLAHRVERAVLCPRVRDVPLVGIPRDRVDRHRFAAHLTRALGVAEARDGTAARLPAGSLRVDAARDRGVTRVAAEVDVDVSAPRLVPQEAGEVASVLPDRDAVAVPLPADLGVDRARHPRRAVDAHADVVRELLPAWLPGRRAGGRLLALRRRRLDAVVAHGATGARQRQQHDQESPAHPTRG